MKKYTKWRNLMIVLMVIVVGLLAYMIWAHDWVSVVLLVLISGLFSAVFIGFWRNLKKRGLQTEFDISRILGRDAKDALQVGDVGILTYNDEFVVTWTSDFFREHGIDIVNKKVTSWIENIRELFEIGRASCRERV